MNKPFDFISSSFAANLSDTYSISIRQQPDGYYFCVTNHKNECIAIKHIITEHITPALLANEPLLQLNYNSSTYIGYGTFAIAPKALILDENYISFLPIEKNLRMRAKIVVNPVNPDTIIASYSNQWTIPNITTIHKHHEIEILIQLALQATHTNSIWVDITSNHINVVVIKNHRLHLANTYSIACDNDAAYYILACYQQFELSQETTPLTITGNITNINPTPFLKDYIRHIESLKPNTWNQELPNEYITMCALQTYNLEK